MSAFKGWQSTQKNNLFAGFPDINFPGSQPVYGFPDCSFWLDAKKFIASNWKDTVKGIIFVNGSNAPTFSSSDASFGNNPVVIFGPEGSGSVQQNMVTNNGSVPLSGTMAFIAKCTTNNSSYNTLFGINSGGSSIGSGGSSMIFARQGLTGFGVYANPTGIISSVFVNPTPNNAVNIVVLTKNELVVNGVSVLSGLWTPSLSYSGIGGSTNNTGLRGRLAEWLTWSSQASSAEMIRISDAINAKYGIY